MNEDFSLCLGRHGCVGLRFGRLLIDGVAPHGPNDTRPTAPTPDSLLLPVRSRCHGPFTALLVFVRLIPVLNPVEAR